MLLNLWFLSWQRKQMNTFALDVTCSTVTQHTFLASRILPYSPFLQPVRLRSRLATFGPENKFHLSLFFKKLKARQTGECPMDQNSSSSLSICSFPKIQGSCLSCVGQSAEENLGRAQSIVLVPTISP